MDQLTKEVNMNKNAVAVQDNNVPVIVANNPMQMIAAAVAKGVDTEQLTKLMDLQERWEKNEARKAFADAMVRFKATPIEISKNKDVAFGNTRYSHATLDNVCRQIIAALQSVGIAHSWKPEMINGGVRVSCILRHQLGHEECVTLDAPPDASGQKNAIQALASSITYLERYSLLAATGIAVGLPDNDGASEEFVLTVEQKASFDDSINEAKSAGELSAVWKIIVKACNDAKDKEAYADFKGKVSVRGAEFKAAA